MSGVHSLERSAQEDTLLVLFNTALSNLVSASARVKPRSYDTRNSERFPRGVGSIPKQLCPQQRYHWPFSVLPVKHVHFGSGEQSVALPIHAFSHYQGMQTVSYMTSPLLSVLI